MFLIQLMSSKSLEKSNQRLSEKLCNGKCQASAKSASGNGVLENSVMNEIMPLRLTLLVQL